MANQTRTQQPKGRFGRSSSAKAPASGRSLRARSGEAGARGRFGLGSSLGPSAYGRGTTGGRSSSSGAGWRTSRSRAKASEQSGMGKALSALTGLSTGKAAKKTTSRSAKPAGFALLAGAAGLALKNREKLMGLAGRGHEAERSGTTPRTEAYSGSTPGPQEDNRSVASPMGTTEGTLATPPQPLDDQPRNDGGQGV